MNRMQVLQRSGCLEVPRPIHLPVLPLALLRCGGPLTACANEAVLNMLQEVGDVSQIDKYIAKAKR